MTGLNNSDGDCFLRVMNWQFKRTKWFKYDRDWFVCK